MEVYTLDSLLRRNQVIDSFKSLIWTERFSEYGDFELHITSTRDSRSLLTAGTHLSMSESHYVMVIETVKDSVDGEGEMILEVKGRSLETILLDRVAKESTDDLTTSPKWTITGPPAVVARKIFHDICVLGVLDPGDIIPYVIEGTFMPSSTIAEPVDPITVEIEPTSVYDATTDICNVWDLGFRLLRYYDSTKLYYDIYTGSDRTTSQHVLPPVVFTPELDNLQDTEELTTIENAKNVAYVYSAVGFQKVYAVGVDPEVEGFERKVLAVHAIDITEETPNPELAMIQLGIEELSKYRTYQAFDGEISQDSQYKYGVHYYLGDVVEMRSADGVTNNMKVTEQIFVSDGEGERSYPTLTLNTFINTGSWLSWLNNKVWADLGPETWEEQP